MAVSLIPGKLADEVLEPVVKKLDKVDGNSSKATGEAEKKKKKKKKKKRKKSARLKYLGKTPGKKSRTGKEVIARMRKDGKIRDKFGKYSI